MARLNVLLTGYEITDYLFERTSSTALALDHDTIRGTADLEIWTGAGGTGTQLALTTDYTVSDEDTDLSTEAGVSIYTKLAIVNGTYHNVDLYATYKTIGDYNSTSSVRLVQIGLKEITGNYTVTADDRTIIVNTASAVTITLPEGLPIGFDVCISRALASTNAVTVARTGSDTIEGGTSFVTHGVFESSTYNSSEIKILKKTFTEWYIVTLPVIKAEYSNQTVTAATTALKYTTKVTDTHASYDTSTGRFTAPINGSYSFIPIIKSSTTSYGRIGLYKGGVLQYYIGNTPNANLISAPLPGEIYLVKGEYIDFRSIDYGLTASSDDRMLIKLAGF